MPKSLTTLSELENTLYDLNYKWNLQAMSLWNGNRRPSTAD